MIPKNNFKSLHRKYYCLKFLVFKLQVKESVLCGCLFKTHSEGRREGRPLFLLQRPGLALRKPLGRGRAQAWGHGPPPQHWRPGGNLGVSPAPCESTQDSLVLRG